MKLPIEYRWLKAHNFEGLTPWYLIEPKESSSLREEYQIETGKDILPFAKRQDNDDIAGFEVINNEASSKIITAHLTWSRKRENPGYPTSNESDTIFQWISNIVFPITQEWMTEDELQDIIDNR